MNFLTQMCGFCELGNTNDIAEPFNVNAKTSMMITRLRSGSLRQKPLLKHKLRTPRKTTEQISRTDESQLEVTCSTKPVSTTGRKKKAAAKRIRSPTDGVVLDNGLTLSSETESSTLSAVKSRRPRKQYVCSVCGRELKSKSSLDIHTRTHTGDRPFVCQICGREFRANGNLTRHQVTHTHPLMHAHLIQDLSLDPKIGY